MKIYRGLHYMILLLIFTLAGCVLTVQPGPSQPATLPPAAQTQLDPATQALIQLARQDLAQSLNLPAEEILLESVHTSAEPTGVTVIRLEANGEWYEYHGQDQAVTRVPGVVPPTLFVEIEDADDLIATLRASGATVEPLATEAEFPQPIFSAPTRTINLNGNQVTIYEFPDIAAAQTAGLRISPAGDQVEPETVGGDATTIDMGTPHFYRQGRVIVLYLGGDEATLEALERVLGPPFAGGEANADHNSVAF